MASLGYNGAPGAVLREEEEAWSNLLYARDEDGRERLQVRPGVPLYRQGPGGYKVAGVRLPASQPGALWLGSVRLASRSPYCGPTSWDKGPTVTEGSDDDALLYGWNQLSFMTRQGG